MDIKLIIFLAISTITLAFAAIVAFSRNIIYSAFALLGVFAGILGLYVMLSADFVAVIQLVVYIGGILVLILFAVMFTTRVDLVTGKRLLLNRAAEPLAAFVGVAILGGLIWRFIHKSEWVVGPRETFEPTSALIGNKFLQEYLLPFEIVSFLLVLVLIGAIVLSRREVK